MRHFYIFGAKYHANNFLLCLLSIKNKSQKEYHTKSINWVVSNWYQKSLYSMLLFWWYIKGVLHLLPQISMFVLNLKVINTFLEIYVCIL